MKKLVKWWNEMITNVNEMTVAEFSNLTKTWIL